jgi:uncharacterized protein YodC (DUF2158 family)
VKQRVGFLTVTENAAYMCKWWKAKNCIRDEFRINSLGTFSISVSKVIDSFVIKMFKGIKVK